MMKNRAMAVIVAATLLIAAGGESLAVGKLGGAGGGTEIAGGSGPLFAGKLGGAGGADEFLLPPSLFVGKLGGASGADEFLLPPSLLAGKLGGVTGEEIGALVTESDDVPSITILPGAKLGVATGEE